VNCEGNIGFFTTPSLVCVVRKLGKIGGKGVTIQENNVVSVNGSNGSACAIIESDEIGLFRMGVCWFVQDVITGNPGI